MIQYIPENHTVETQDALWDLFNTLIDYQEIRKVTSLTLPHSDNLIPYGSTSFKPARRTPNNILLPCLDRERGGEIWTHHRVCLDEIRNSTDVLKRVMSSVAVNKTQN